MKRPSLALVGVLFVLAITFSSQARKTTTLLQSIQPVSANDLELMLQAVEQTTPLPATQAPESGTFYTVQHAGDWPPFPDNTMNLPFWSIGDGYYVLDDRNVDYAALQAEAEAAALLSEPASLNSGSSMMMAMSLASSYSYDNTVYLTNLVVSAAGYQPMTASFSIGGGTNFVPYDILMTTNLLKKVSDWNWLGIGYTSNRYTFNNQPADMAFYALAKPSKTMIVGWGDDSYEQCDPPSGLTNTVVIATGEFHSVAVKEDGTVVQWGYDFGGVPADLTNAVTVDAGYEDSIAVRSNGTVVVWGANTYGETNVPANLSGVKAVGAGWAHNVALLTNGTVTAWGNNYYGQTNVPADLTNVTAISVCSFHSLALKSNGMVEGWGYNFDNEIISPAGLSNVVAIAAGLQHSLALKADGTVTAWGDNSAGQNDVPVGLSNVVAITAGWWHARPCRMTAR